MLNVNDRKSRLDLLKLIKERDSDPQPADTPFFKELRNQYQKWFTAFQRRAREAIQKPRYRWTRDLYEKYRTLDPKEFVCGSYFLGLEDDIYPIHLQEICDVFNMWREGKITETIDISALGIGKTWKAGILAALLTFDTLIHPNPPTMYGLEPRSKIALAIMSRNARLAKEVTFTQMMPFFDCGFFMDYFPPQVNIAEVEESRIYPAQLKFPKRFSIFPGSGTYLSVLGYNLLFTILDEFAWMEKVTKSVRAALGFQTEYDAAEEAYAHTEQRIFSRTYAGERKGLIIMVSAPRTRYDYAERKYEQGVKFNKILESGADFESAISLTRKATAADKAKGLTGKVYIKPTEAGGVAPKAIYAMKRKAVWRARPQYWKGKCVWSGDYLLFDMKTMQFISDQVYNGLFDNDIDFTDDGLFKIPVEVVERFRENPHRAIRDIGAQATAGIHSFFGDLGKIKSFKNIKNHAKDIAGVIKIERYYLKEEHEFPKPIRYGHADLARNKDVAAAAICFVSGWKDSPHYESRLPIARFDWLHEVYARPGYADIRLEDVFDLFVETGRRGFIMGLVSFDGFQSLHSMQRLWDDHRIPTGHVSIDSTAQRLLIAGALDKGEYGAVKKSIVGQPLAAWEEFRIGLYDERIELPVYEKEGCSLLQQFEQEELFVDAKGGKGMIDHPPGGKHDLLQCLVGAYWNLINNEWWVSAFTEFEPDTYGDAMAQSRDIEKKIDKSALTDKDLKLAGF